MSTATAPALTDIITELRSAWSEYQTVEKKGLAFGQRLYELRRLTSAQGNHSGDGFLPKLQQAGIPQRTAYYWIHSYELSIGEREKKPSQSVRTSVEAVDSTPATVELVNGATSEKLITVFKATGLNQAIQISDGEVSEVTLPVHGCSIQYKNPRGTTLAQLREYAEAVVKRATVKVTPVAPVAPVTPVTPVIELKDGQKVRIDGKVYAVSVRGGRPILLEDNSDDAPTPMKAPIAKGKAVHDFTRMRSQAHSEGRKYRCPECLLILTTSETYPLKVFCNGSGGVECTASGLLKGVKINGVPVIRKTESGDHVISVPQKSKTPKSDAVVPEMTFVENFLGRDDATVLFDACDRLEFRRKMTRGGLARHATVAFSSVPDKHQKTLPLESAPDPIRDLSRRLTKFAGKPVNYLAVVRYESGDDYMNWHQHECDRALPDATTYIVSTGAERPFSVRPVDGRATKVTATAGSLIVLPSSFNTTHEHAVPKARGVSTVRYAVNCKSVPVKNKP